MKDSIQPIRFTKQESKLLLKALILAEHYSQKDQSVLRFKIQALTERNKTTTETTS